MRRLRSGIAGVILAAGVTGCGLTNPYRTGHPSQPAIRTDHTRSTSTLPAVSLPARTVPALLRRYTLLSINWTSATLAANQRHLARLAVDGARDQALQTAASYAHGTSLQRSSVTNHGQITSIAPGQGPRAGEWVITTVETTRGRGDYQNLPAQPHIYAARVTRTRHGWVVSTWSPQS